MVRLEMSKDKVSTHLLYTSFSNISPRRLGPAIETSINMFIFKCHCDTSSILATVHEMKYLKVNNSVGCKHLFYFAKS